jgi:hypothetical protein
VKRSIRSTNTTGLLLSYEDLRNWKYRRSPFSIFERLNKPDDRSLLETPGKTNSCAPNMKF